MEFFFFSLIDTNNGISKVNDKDQFKKKKKKTR